MLIARTAAVLSVALFAGCMIDVSIGTRRDGAGGDGGGGFDAGPGCEIADADQDGDGFSIEAGDCDDCDPTKNPNAVEVPTEDGRAAVDEDCDGELDERDPECDAGLVLDDDDPLLAARAIDLCRMATSDGGWGLVSASWVLPDGSPPPAVALGDFHKGHGLIDSFGPLGTQRGSRMLAISSGYARRPSDAGYVDHYQDKGYTSGHPQGFPKEEPSCPGVMSGTPHDGAALELVIHTPSNAAGIAFDFDFYTYEWPTFVCSPFNDFFVALLSPGPADSDDGSISFDSMHNTVSVNSAFLSVCGCPENPPDPCPAPPLDPLKLFSCPSGNAELAGTGFGGDTEFDGDHGATSWLFTRTSVPANEEITIRFAIYDSEDGAYDSLALIDNFRWIAKDYATVTAPL